ncbi:PREDICTED: uncharacterized protein LOC104810614 [Tarenaya hassleriana]|uniref:uncharacterized protein LOC104810614 n=1 Tax=Tarenaya hassleriana TaxID=28532 RepID=UPI00053C3E02|nr:PREDICTED: uncharacterized protein LOC104810614 [Tarenaya hassleriana]
MDCNKNIFKTLSLFLVLQVVIIPITESKEIDYVNLNITIRNEMKGLKRPEVVYRCRSKRKDYGWRRSRVPGTQHTFPIVVEVNESVIPAIHLCNFRSVMGTADLVIRNTYLDAEVCPRSSCVHDVTPDGIKFRGHELDFRFAFH